MSAAIQTERYYLNDAQTIYIGTNGSDMLLKDKSINTDKILSNLLTGTLVNGQIAVSYDVTNIANYPTLTFDSVKNSLSINNTNATTANLSVKQAITMWVAGGYDTGIWSSNDGFVWINRGIGVMDSISCMAYNGTIWVASGGSTNYTIAYSNDGINWTGVVNSKTLLSSTCRNVVWNGSMWVGIGAGTNSMLYSYDGINWNAGTNIFTGTTTQGQGVAWNGTVWLAVGEGSVNLATSTDGINWTAVPTYSTSLYSSNMYNGCHSVAWGGNKWIIGGYAKNSAMYYTTNTTALTGWTAISGTGFNSMGAGKSIAWNGSYWIALSGNNSSGNNSIIKSTDGITWTGVSNVFTIAYGASWNGKMWLAAGTNGSNGLLMYSYDGNTWSQLTGVTFPGTLTGIASRNAPSLVPAIIAPYPPIQEWVSSVGDIVATVNAVGDLRILNDFWIDGNIKIGSPSITSNTFNYSMPTTAGTSGQVLTSAGTGNELTWSAGGGGSITFPIVSNNLTTAIQLSNTTTPANTINSLLNINNLITGNFYGMYIINSGGIGFGMTNTGGGIAIDINSTSSNGISTSLGSGSTPSHSALNVTNWASDSSTFGLYLENMSTGNGVFIKNDSIGAPLSIVNSNSASIFKVDSAGNVDIPTGANFRIGGVNMGGGMVYPGTGVPNSTGSAWGTSYAVGSAANNIPQLDSNGKLTEDTIGTAAGLTSDYIDWNASSGGQFIQNKPIIYKTDYVYSDAITLTWAAPTVTWDYSISAHAIVNPYLISQNKTLDIINVTEGAEGVLIYSNLSDIFTFPTNSVFTNGNNVAFGGNTMAICRFKYYTDQSGTKFHWTIERPINFNDIDVGGSANSMVPIWNSNGYVGLTINPLPNQYQLYTGSSMPSTLSWDVTLYSSAYLPIIYASTTHTLALDNLFAGASGTLLIRQPTSGNTLSFNWPNNSYFQNGVQSINMVNGSVTVATFYSDGVNIYWNISGSYS
jgi:hypothetical protein